MKPAYSLVLFALLAAAQASAQPADLPIPPATTSEYPSGVRVREAGSGSVYADRRGLVLYGMDMRTVLRWATDPAQYCRDQCAAEWEPLLAPPGFAVNLRYPGAGGRPQSDYGGGQFLDNRKAPDWTVIAGPQGPQWVYKGWHMVFTRRGSEPGSVEFDGHDGRIWNTLKYIPPVPQVVAPPGVRPAFIGQRYVLADSQGRPLFTGTCLKPCTWTPLPAAMASRGIGKWKVDRSLDTPQWRLGAQPVFVETEAGLPTGARHLQP